MRFEAHHAFGSHDRVVPDAGGEIETLARGQDEAHSIPAQTEGDRAFYSDHDLVELVSSLLESLAWQVGPDRRRHALGL